MIGWYRYDKAADSYDVFAAHWLSVVGYGAKENGQRNANTLILHDSAKRAAGHTNYYVDVAQIMAGTQSDPNRMYAHGFPRTAKGALSLGKELVFKDTATHAIVQGAYRIEM